jgi:glycosyltransferase involved in cell wall biosynthesis
MIDTEGRLITSIPKERIFAVSGKVARELSYAYGLEREKIRITPGASRFPLSSKIKHNAKEGYVIGFVGGNVYTKGIALLADVIGELHTRRTEVRCVGAGCGKDVREFLQGRCKFESLGKHEILPSFYHGLDCFVSLGPYEAWSLSTIEAMSQMVPVVSTEENGVFEGAEGRFALAGRSVVRIADMVERVLTDSEFAEVVVKSGLDIVNKLNWEENAKKYEELYAKLL